MASCGGPPSGLGNSLAGYVQTSHGRRVVPTIFVGNVPVPTAEDFNTVVADQAEMIEAMYRYLWWRRLERARLDYGRRRELRVEPIEGGVSEDEVRVQSLYENSLKMWRILRSG